MEKQTYHYFIIECKPNDIEQIMPLFETLKAEKHYVTVTVSTHIRSSRVTKVSAKKFKKETE